ncbi:peptidoglycan D,D-transpeptidase FtsI family protein, partial [Xanthomonas campestris]
PDDIQSWLAAQAAGKTGQPVVKPQPADLDPALVPDPVDEVSAGIPTALAPGAAPAQPAPLQESRQ